MWTRVTREKEDSHAAEEHQVRGGDEQDGDRAEPPPGGNRSEHEQPKERERQCTTDPIAIQEACVPCASVSENPVIAGSSAPLNNVCRVLTNTRNAPASSTHPPIIATFTHRSFGAKASGIAGSSSVAAPSVRGRCRARP